MSQTCLFWRKNLEARKCFERNPFEDASDRLPLSEWAGDQLRITVENVDLSTICIQQNIVWIFIESITPLLCKMTKWPTGCAWLTDCKAKYIWRPSLHSLICNSLKIPQWNVAAYYIVLQKSPVILHSGASSTLNISAENWIKVQSWFQPGIHSSHSAEITVNVCIVCNTRFMEY